MTDSNHSQAERSAQAHREWKSRSLKCPHCMAAMRIRSSYMLSDTCREGVIECSDGECGFRATFSTSINATLAVSDNPNPAVDLPLTESAKRNMRQAIERDDARTTTAARSR